MKICCYILHLANDRFVVSIRYYANNIVNFWLGSQKTSREEENVSSDVCFGYIPSRATILYSLN